MFPRLSGPVSESPNKDHSIVGSISGLLTDGNPPLVVVHLLHRTQDTEPVDSLKGMCSGRYLCSPSQVQVGVCLLVAVALGQDLYGSFQQSGGPNMDYKWWGPCCEDPKTGTPPNLWNLPY